MKIIDGKKIAKAIRLELKEEISQFDGSPHLYVVLVGADPASQIYVRNKHKACLKIGMRSTVKEYPADISEQALLKEIEKLNQDDDIHGILVQLPLPSHIGTLKVLEAVDPKKDVDAFHPMNRGLLVCEATPLKPCTPLGCMEMLKREGIELKGKNAVIVGCSLIVGRPLAEMMIQEDATVTLCHSETRNLKSHVENADILAIAVGQPEMIKRQWVRDDCIIIDIGINRKEDGSIVGDVDFNSLTESEDFTGMVTPVPGGVGPMTIAMLLKNTVVAWKEQLASEG